MNKQDIDKIVKIVKKEPCLIQDISKAIGKSWVTTERYVNRIEKEKGIIKVSNTFFASDEINKIALVAPNATLILIKDFKVVEKKRVDTPDAIVKIVKCFNPNCITNNEDIPTRFDVIKNEDELKLRCHYCEKTTSKENMVFL